MRNPNSQQQNWCKSMSQTKLLAYLGLIPFLVAIFLNEFYSQEYTAFGLNLPSPQFMFVAYSAVILSFLSGTLWKRDLKPTSKSVQLYSNLFSILAFVSVMIPIKVALIVLPVAYLLLLITEQNQLSNQAAKNGYLQLRYRITLAVIFLHPTAFFFWFI